MVEQEKAHMFLRYMIEEYGYDVHPDNFSSQKFEKPPYNDFKELAEECAQWHYDYCDGWEETNEWQKGQTVVLYDDLTNEEVARHKVSMSFEQRFDVV